MEGERQEREVQQGALDLMNALTDKQRIAALDAARKRIAGDEPSVENEPKLEDYERNTYTRYPPTLMQTFRRLGYLILFAAFFASAIRIFMAAFEMSAASIQSFEIAILIGLVSVLLAESGQVAFTLWAATTDSIILRIALWIGALGCTAFALIGNAHIVRPWVYAYLHVLAWVETFLPPVLVLIASHVLKSQALHTIENRHAAQVLWEEEHRTWEERIKTERKAWQQVYDNAHLDSRWMHCAANALRDALIGANGNKSRVVRGLRDGDWRALVLREMSAEQWYERAEYEAEQMRLEAERQRIAEEMRLEARTQERKRKITPRPVHQSVGATSGVRTGETDGQVRDNGDGTFTATCPYCGEAFMRDSRKGATNALPGHFRKCVVRKAQNAVHNATPEGVADALQTAVNGHSAVEIID